ncbi:hypothetical protein BDZ91DRAFT_720257 [Kalaharituber pfeilii]|nr:hypothetical protein BDZ91DRAFT_720257 [Kalaharituber pfeilii]
MATQQLQEQKTGRKQKIERKKTETKPQPRLDIVSSRKTRAEKMNQTNLQREKPNQTKPEPNRTISNPEEFR